MTVPQELQTVLVGTPGALGGSIRFDGTRIPVQAFIDTLDEGDGNRGVSRQLAGRLAI